MHVRSLLIAFAIVVLSTVAFAQPGNIPAPVNPGILLDAYQVNYLPSPIGGGTPVGWINLTNTGQLGADAFGPLSGTTGRICVNVYVFTADEQETECCTCLVTPNALVHLNAADLTNNAGNGVTPTLGIVVKLLATIPGASTSTPGTNGQTLFDQSTCNAARPFVTANLAPGMRAWAVKGHTNQTTSPSSTSLTETAFLPSLLSNGELTKLTQLCQFLRGNQSGAGRCKTCDDLNLGGIGGGKK